MGLPQERKKLHTLHDGVNGPSRRGQVSLQDTVHPSRRPAK